MKQIAFIILVLLASCESKPEFYIDGKPYITRSTCIKEEFTVKYYGPRLVRECVEWRIDTLEWKE